MELVPSLPSNSLIQAMRRATQIRIMPNGLPRFSTIYGSATQDLSAALGPVPILFSIDPPHDIPAKSTAAAAAPAPPPVPTSIQNLRSPAPSVQQLPVQSQAATLNVIALSPRRVLFQKLELSALVHVLSLASIHPLAREFHRRSRGSYCISIFGPTYLVASSFY